MEEKKILVGIPCSRRLEIVGIDPQALSCLFLNPDTWPWVKKRNSENSKNNKRAKNIFA